ncbi:sigma-70 family RNA polymerase sigma factor family protein [Streptacidiphilus sp. PAMC 29251]
MTGSVGDAGDIVQDAFLGLTRARQAGTVIADLKAYLATAVTRLGINHLGSARVRREAYVGDWLPEGDGGGKARAIGRSVTEPRRVAQLLVGGFRRLRTLGISFRSARINGRPGMVMYDADERVVNVVALDMVDGVIHAIHTASNPDKLARLGPVSDIALLLPK